MNSWLPICWTNLLQAELCLMMWIWLHWAIDQWGAWFTVNQPSAWNHFAVKNIYKVTAWNKASGKNAVWWSPVMYILNCPCVFRHPGESMLPAPIVWQAAKPPTYPLSANQSQAHVIFSSAEAGLPFQPCSWARQGVQTPSHFPDNGYSAST